MAEAICLGILVVDVIGRPIGTFPPFGALQLVDSITPHLGGCAANTGVGLQTLGVATQVSGHVGRDGFGDFVKNELHRLGVAANVSEDEDAPTSATMVMVAPDAERAFLHSLGANATFAPDALQTFDGQLLHIAGHGLMPQLDGEPCARLLQNAREQGLKTSLDTAGAPNESWAEKLRVCLPHLDYFVPSLHEAQHLFPQAATPPDLCAQILKAGVQTVALKMGEAGSFVTNGRESHFVPAFKVQAKDATGAGDAFAAGFLCGVLRDFSLHDCARLGNACGALCATEVGTVAGYRSLPETLAFIADNSNQQS